VRQQTRREKTIFFQFFFSLFFFFFFFFLLLSLMKNRSMCRALLHAVLRQLSLSDLVAMTTPPCAIRDEKTVSLLLVDQWLTRQRAQSDATRFARVAWLLGRAQSSVRILESVSDWDVADLSSHVMSSSVIAHVARAFLALAGSSPATAPLRVWTHIYIVDDQTTLRNVDARATLFVLLAQVRELTDRLWAAAMALHAAARIGDSTFYLRICEFMVRCIEPDFSSYAGAFAAEDVKPVVDGSVVLLREPIIPRHNEPTTGFGKNNSRRFMPFERRVLVAKRLGVTSAMPLLAPRIAALTACVPLDDFRCWWLAVLCCAAWQIGDSSLCDAATQQLATAIASVPALSPDALIATALCDFHRVPQQP
jgi:hypothetical protein